MSKQKKQKTPKRNKARLFFLNFGKLVLDLAKLSFASLVLGTIIRGEIPQDTLLLWGIISSGIGSFFGLICLMMCEEK